MGNEKTVEFDQLQLETKGEAGESQITFDIYPDSVHNESDNFILDPEKQGSSKGRAQVTRGADFGMDEELELKLTHVKSTLSANHLVSDWFIKLASGMPAIFQAPLWTATRARRARSSSRRRCTTRSAMRSIRWRGWT